MKVLFIHHGEVPGGAPTSLINTILGIKQMNPTWELKVWCINQEMCDFFLKKTGIKTEIIINPLKEIGKILIGWTPLFYGNSFKELFKNARYIRGRIRDFQQLLMNEKPDLVHLNSATLFVPAIAAKRMNVPVIMHVREVFGGGKWSLKRILVGKWYQKLVNHIITISDVEKWSISGTDSEKVTTIYNFVDIERFISNKSVNEIRESLGISNKTHVFITLGGVSPRKGFVEIVKALALLPKEKYHLIVAGPSLLTENSSITYRDRLFFVLEDILCLLRIRPFKFFKYQKRATLVYQRLKDKINVTFFGNVNEVPEYLNCSDSLLFLGTTPHFPRPVYEAWLLNKPVLVSNVLGIKEHISIGRDGLVANINSTADIAMKMKEISNKSWYINETGRVKSINLFNQQTNTIKIVKLFQKVIQESNIQESKS